MKKITLLALLISTLSFGQASISITGLSGNPVLETSGNSTDKLKPMPGTIVYNLNGTATSSITNTAVIIREFDAAGTPLAFNLSIFYKPALLDNITANGGSTTGTYSFQIPSTGSANARIFFLDSQVPASSTLATGHYYGISTYTTLGGVIVNSPVYPVTIVPYGVTLSTESFSKNSISFSPNPAKDVINFSSEIITKTYKVVTLTGAVVKEVAATGSLNVADLPKGIYLIVTDAGIGKLIKE